MLDCCSAGAEGTHYNAGNNVAAAANNEDMMSVHSSSSRSVASASVANAATRKGKRGVAKVAKTPSSTAGLKLKKRSSNVSSGNVSMISGTSGQTIYRKNKAMKELQAADAISSMDDFAHGTAMFMPGSSTEIVHPSTSKFSSNLITKTTSLSIKKH